MKRTHRLLAILMVVLAILMVALLFSCGPDPVGSSTGDDTDTQTEEVGENDAETQEVGDNGVCQPSCQENVCVSDGCGSLCPACNDLPAPYGNDCQISGSPDPPSAMTTVNAFPNLIFDRPVHATSALDGTNRLFVVEKPGVIKVFPNNPQAKASDVGIFLNIVSKVDSGPNEAGLLSVAFHPNYANNGFFFVHYNRNNGGQLQTVIARFSVSADANKASTSSEKIVMTMNQPWGNHNGGQIEFGHDGFLYIGMGDGGAGGDPLGSGQDLSSLLGKMLRIDVDTPGTYKIPADNPFAANPAQGRPEIWAWGLRNPWRFSFDRLTGQLWTGDVGQDVWEEVHIVEAGKNYGWNIMEGNHCFKPKFGCNEEGLELPITEYDHSVGESITGGFVYRGKEQPNLFGAYIYGDYGSGRIFAVRFGAEEEAQVTELVNTKHFIASFGEDENGELLVVDFPYFNPTQGRLYRLVPQTQGANSTNQFPLKLSQTGCFSNIKNATPSDGLLSYSVNAPLWHDGADSERYVALPQGAKFSTKTPGAWAFPDGTVFIKTFVYGKDTANPFRVETRFEIKSASGYDYYSYKWNEDQSDAVLLSGAAEHSFEIGGETVTWHYPSRSQCKSCHLKAADSVLGWHTGQLNKTHKMGTVQVD
jgi:glucose/arabinose dehydrogenase